MSTTRKNVTEIYFNAGTSRRVIDFITQNYPKLDLNYDVQGNLVKIMLPLNSDENYKNELILKLRNMYPFEVRETYLA